MNIFKRLFNWVQSGPVDFCYVSGEWGFQEGIRGKRISSKEPAKILEIPAKLPGRVATVVAAKGKVATRAASNIAATVEEFHATSEAYDPVLAEIFSTTPASNRQEQEEDAYVHVHAER